MATRLRLSNAERDRLVALSAGPWPVVDLDGPARRRLLYRLNADRFRNAALYAWADALSGGATGDRRAEEWLELIACADTTLPSFPLKGRDALELGLPPGPEIGRLMDEVEAWWIDGDFRADRAACLAHLATLAGSISK